MQKPLVADEVGHGVKVRDVFRAESIHRGVHHGVSLRGGGADEGGGGHRLNLVAETHVDTDTSTVPKQSAYLRNQSLV